MPPVRYYNQTGPFWDFVASLEEQGASHPLFAGNSAAREAANNIDNNETGEHGGPSEPAGAFWGPWGPFAYRGRHGSPPPPPPPPQTDCPPGPPPAEGEKDHEMPSEPEGPHHGHGHGPRGHGHRHGPRGHHGPHARGGHCGRGRGAWGGRGRRGMFPYSMGPFGPFVDALYGQFTNGPDAGDATEDFRPEVDVFDTPESFVVHVSLPGAKKEDVGVNWDVEKSELSIAGVIHRPGDEEFLKTLAMDERKVGAFERKVRLGSRANPAQVDVDAIAAKLEDGVLRIDVPKLDAGYVEIKKVDIE